MYRSCLATAWRPEPKKGAGGGAEVRGRPTHDTGQGTRECHALMAIERVSRAFTVITHRHSSTTVDTQAHTGQHTPRGGDTPGQPKVCDSVSPGGLPIKNLKGLRHTQTTRTTSQTSHRATTRVCPRKLHTYHLLSPLYGCTLHGWQRGRRIATQHIPQGLHTPPRTWALSHG